MRSRKYSEKHALTHRRWREVAVEQVHGPSDAIAEWFAS